MKQAQARDIANGHAEFLRLLPIDLEPEGGCARVELRIDVADLGTLLGRGDEFVGDARQFIRGGVRARLQLERETTSIPQSGDGRRIKREHGGLGDRRAVLIHTEDDVAQTLARNLALVPGLERSRARRNQPGLCEGTASRQAGGSRSVARQSCCLT